MLSVFVSTSSFANWDDRPLKLIEETGVEFQMNPYGRKLTGDELVNLASGAVGLIAGTEQIDASVLSRLSGLKVISRCGAGMDNVDLNAARKLGIKVFNTPDAPTLAVAELTVGLMLTLLRQVYLMDRDMRSGKWNKRIGNLLYNKNVGIIGFGRIGRKVAELLKSLGARPFYTDPNISEEEPREYQRLILDELLNRADIVSLHLSYSKENYKLLGPKEFSMMKQGSFLINCSRGAIVDEDALYSELKEGRLAGAAIDVFEQEPYNGPLKKLDNVILTPHIGSYAKESRVEMEIQAVKNLLEGLGV